MDTSGETTRLLNAFDAGDATAMQRLFTLIYDELHTLAQACFRRQPRRHTLQSTALVNEAFLRLVGATRADWTGRAHFLAVAARAMRQILIDHARAQHRAKRGGGWREITIEEAATPITETPPNLLELDDALQQLAALDARQSRIVELRFFGGLTVEQVAQVLQLSRSTVESEWRMARAWLRRELERRAAP
jgi:RNA polymerase sigma-70 factor, ECF subfamily